MKKACLLFLSNIFVFCFSAQVALSSDSRPLRLSYQAFSSGILTANLVIDFDSTAKDYDIEFTGRSAGLVRALAAWSMEMRATGKKYKNALFPEKFALVTQSKSKRVTKIAFPSRGRVPHVEIIPAIVPREGEEVNVQHTLYALDPASFVMHVSEQISRKGHCNGSSAVYDGRSVFQMTLKDMGWQSVKDIPGFKGKAIRCRLTAKGKSGRIMRPTSRDRLRSMEIWFAVTEPGAAVVPVKLTSKLSSGISLKLVLEKSRLL